MKKQILDLAEVRVGQVLKVVKPSGNITFWIIKSSKGAEVTQEYLEKRYIKNKPDLVNFINQFGLSRLDVVEFNEHSTKWGMTINTKTSDKFFSVNDSDYVFSFYKSSLKEARK